MPNYLWLTFGSKTVPILYRLSESRDRLTDGRRDRRTDATRCIRLLLYFWIMRILCKDVGCFTGMRVLSLLYQWSHMNYHDNTCRGYGPFLSLISQVISAILQRYILGVYAMKESTSGPHQFWIKLGQWRKLSGSILLWHCRYKLVTQTREGFKPLQMFSWKCMQDHLYST